MQDPILDLVALSILCFGALVAMVTPHQSLVEIRIIGYSDAYSAICGRIAVSGMDQQRATA